MTWEGRTEQRLVDALVQAMPTAIATKITAITTDKGVTLPTLLQTEAREATDGVSYVPHLAITIDGPSDREDWMTKSTDLVVPIRLVMSHHAQDTPALADQYAWYYCRAMELALTSVCISTLAWTAPDTSSNLCGVWMCRIDRADIQTWGDDRNRRQSVVDATVYLRTYRS